MTLWYLRGADCEVVLGNLKHYCSGVLIKMLQITHKPKQEAEAHAGSRDPGWLSNVRIQQVELFRCRRDFGLKVLNI